MIVPGMGWGLPSLQARPAPAPFRMPSLFGSRSRPAPAPAPFRMPAPFGSRGMRGLGDGVLSDAWKTLTSNVGTKVTESSDRIEFALRLSTAAAISAMVFAAWAAWNTRRR
jgi:hypothetical protein